MMLCIHTNSSNLKDTLSQREKGALDIESI